MRVLVACECSGCLTDALLEHGVNAWSCDLSPSFGKHPERHYVCDVFDVLSHESFDRLIAFPPCTHLTCANGKHLREKIADGRTQTGLDFFLKLWSFPGCVCLENPLGVIPKFLGLKYSQIVSPHQFGSTHKKRTCLWLRGLPLLLPTAFEPGKSFIQLLPGGSFKRSILDPFLAQAMASQWSFYLGGF